MGHSIIITAVGETYCCFTGHMVAPELRPEEGGKLLGNRGEPGIPSAAPELTVAGDTVTPACLGSTASGNHPTAALRVLGIQGNSDLVTQI